jgi:hypothetical protein
MKRAWRCFWGWKLVSLVCCVLRPRFCVFLQIDGADTISVSNHERKGGGSVSVRVVAQGDASAAVAALHCVRDVPDLPPR